MSNTLTNHQMFTLMQFSPELDAIAPSLPPELQARLLKLQQRTGAAYAGDSSTAPTKEHTKEILGSAYMALDEKRETLRELMDKIDMTPSFINKRSFIGNIVHHVQNIFR